MYCQHFTSQILSQIYLQTQGLCNYRYYLTRVQLPSYLLLPLLRQLLDWALMQAGYNNYCNQAGCNNYFERAGCNKYFDRSVVIVDLKIAFVLQSHFDRVLDDFVFLKMDPQKLICLFPVGFVH